MIKYLLCAAGGVAIGYYVAHVRLEEDFQKQLERETDEARDFYRRKYMKKAKEEGEDQGLTEAAIKTAEALRQSYEGVTVGPSILAQEMSATVQRAVERGELDVEPEADIAMTDELVKNAPDVTVTVTEPKPERLPFSTEIPKMAKTPVNYNRISTPSKVEALPAPETPAVAERDEIDAAVITRQAFIDNEFKYDQFSLTYYAGDDVLANEEEEPMKGNRAHMLGREVAEKIKVGRKAMEGSDTIFVRNHTGKWEFEVTRSEGKYSDEVGVEAG